MSNSYATPWTVAHQAPLSMGFPRQEYWSRLSFPSPGILTNWATREGGQSLTRVWCFVTHGLQHARLPCTSPTLGAYSNLCPLSLFCHPTISSFVIPFSSCLQSFPASGSFPMNQFFWIWIMNIVLWIVLDIFKSLH